MNPAGLDPIEHPRDIIATKVLSPTSIAMLSRVKVIYNRQEPEQTTVEQLVRHEVHRTAPVGVRSPVQLRPGHRAAMTTRLEPADAEAFLRVQPLDPLAIHHPPLPPELRPDPRIFPRHMHARHLLDP